MLVFLLCNITIGFSGKNIFTPVRWLLPPRPTKIGNQRLWLSCTPVIEHLFSVVKYRARQYKSLSPNKKTLTKNKKCWMLSGLRFGFWLSQAKAVGSNHTLKRAAMRSETLAWWCYRRLGFLLMCSDTNTALRRNHFSQSHRIATLKIFSVFLRPSAQSDSHETCSETMAEGKEEKLKSFFLAHLI